MEGAVTEPPLGCPRGSVVWPMRTSTSSRPSPSSSAPIIPMTVRVPVPMSCAPLAKSTEPSLPMRQLTTQPGRAL